MLQRQQKINEFWVSSFQLKVYYGILNILAACRKMYKRVRTGERVLELLERLGCARFHYHRSWAAGKIQIQYKMYSVRTLHRPSPVGDHLCSTLIVAVRQVLMYCVPMRITDTANAAHNIIMCQSNSKAKSLLANTPRLQRSSRAGALGRIQKWARKQIVMFILIYVANYWLYYVG